MTKVLYWFRNDLRLHDNEALQKAAELGKVLPVYIIDERQFQDTTLGFNRIGAYRLKFLLESLHDLQQNLRKIGSDLVVFRGIPEDILLDLVKKYKVNYFVASKEATQKETDVESEISQRLKPLNIDMELIWGAATLYHPRDLPFQIHYLSDVFTVFRKKMETKSVIRETVGTVSKLPIFTFDEPTVIPSLEDFGYESPIYSEKAVLEFKGGESEALKRLHTYLWETQAIKTYKETRNELVGSNYSSKFSAWMNLGCLSPRFIYEEVKKFEEQVVANESTYWLIFELIWRDYFHFISLKYGVRLFKRSGIKHDMAKTWKKDDEGFKKWINGQTGIPFIDANMRELKETGFMSNRGRQNVASFLTKDLGIEWWWGALYFEYMLIDYDVCSNWGNWNYVSGVGNDPRENRYFNILRQASMYDADAKHAKRWLPELSNIPDEKVHQIGLLSADERKSYGIELGVDYPLPMVDFSKWVKV